MTLNEFRGYVRSRQLELRAGDVNPEDAMQGVLRRLAADRPIAVASVPARLEQTVRTVADEMQGLAATWNISARENALDENPNLYPLLVKATRIRRGVFRLLWVIGRQRGETGRVGTVLVGTPTRADLRADQGPRFVGGFAVRPPQPSWVERLVATVRSWRVI